MSKPSIGRIVHYVDLKGQHRPAIVTRVWADEPDVYYPEADEVVNMTIFPDGSNDNLHLSGTESLIQWGTSVHHDESGKPQTWHWPEQTE